MKLLCDTDFLSVFAKVDRLELLLEAFPTADFLISESVHDELTFSLDEGFDFPKRVFEMVDITGLKRNEGKITLLLIVSLCRECLLDWAFETERFLQTCANDVGGFLFLDDEERCHA